MLGQPASEGLLVSSREPPLRFSATLQLILLRVFAPDECMRCRSGHTCPSFPLGISPPVTHMQEYSTHSAGKESVGSLALILSPLLRRSNIYSRQYSIDCHSVQGYTLHIEKLRNRKGEENGYLMGFCSREKIVPTRRKRIYDTYKIGNKF